MISSADIHNSRVLIVDDQHTNVLLLDRVLRSAGYTFVAATSEPIALTSVHPRRA